MQEHINDHFENAKRYQIPRAQLIIADIPYNIGINAYGSRSDWYINGDNKNGESEKAGKSFFDTDNDFKIYNFFQFCTRLLKKEPKEKGKSPCMIIFCSWQQLNEIKEYAKKFGFNHLWRDRLYHGVWRMAPVFTGCNRSIFTGGFCYHRHARHAGGGTAASVAYRYDTGKMDLGNPCHGTGWLPVIVSDSPAPHV